MVEDANKKALSKLRSLSALLTSNVYCLTSEIFFSS